MSRSLYRTGARLYHAFHGCPADAVARCRAPRLVPPVVVCLGTLQGVIYRSDKWTPGIERNYIHFMEDPPQLVCNPAGTQLYLLGGSYRVTEHGIEG